jgi:predicted DNA-binding transcriptional regulator AlpA
MGVDDDKLLSAAEVGAMLGHRGRMWIWHRVSDPTSGFPQPIKIGGRLHFYRADIAAWLRSGNTGWTPGAARKKRNDNDRAA